MQSATAVIKQRRHDKMSDDTQVHSKIKAIVQARGLAEIILKESKTVQTASPPALGPVVTNCVRIRNSKTFLKPLPLMLHSSVSIRTPTTAPHPHTQHPPLQSLLYGKLAIPSNSSSYSLAHSHLQDPPSSCRSCIDSLTRITPAPLSTSC